MASSMLPAFAVGALDVQPIEAPALRGKQVNPVIGFTVRLEAHSEDVTMDRVEMVLAGEPTLAAVAQVHLCLGKDPPEDRSGIIASATPSSSTLRLQVNEPVRVKDRTFWIAVTLKDNADIDTRLALEVRSARVGGRLINVPPGAARATQRIGVALRQRGDDGSHSYRIPGLARSNLGTLIAVYDIRREHCRDLPARIDVGINRSKDNGRSWSPMEIAMTAAALGPGYAADGIGDPAVLVDRKTGRIWIAALWAHGDIGWASSKPGMRPEETGQLLMTYSDDDGVTWAPMRNLTPSVKDPAWRLCFVSPGSGICTQDGTLVFPAMFRAADGGETQGKPFATILSSRDRGKSWQIGTGAKIDTTESQVVELADGTLMLNARDDRGSSRTVMTTRDLGATWQTHPTDRSALEDPTCMASLLRWVHPRHGDLLIFSNPASSSKRHQMTLKVSLDQGRSWPAALHRLYDARAGSGYSCLAEAGADHIGILYEGRCEIYFLRVPLTDFFR